MSFGFGFGFPRAGGASFSPAALFSAGEVGAWYDPSDSTTLFTTSAGTTPCAAPGSGAQVFVGRMLDKSGNANHANAINDTTARPELSARVNLLTSSENFTVGWSALAASITTNTNETLTPIGTNTASIFSVVGNPPECYVRQVTSQVANTSYILSIFAKAKTATWLRLRNLAVNNNSNSEAWFNLQTGTIGTVLPSVTASIAPAGNGWYRCSISGTTGGTLTNFVDVALSSSDNTRAATSGLDAYYWGAQLVATNAFPANTYQRIADQYTYDVLGFPRYLVFTGATPTAMVTPSNINLTGTNKVTVFGGIRKLDSVGFRQLVELSATVANVGTFDLQANSSAGNNYTFESGGTVPYAGAATSATVYAAPISNVLTGIADIAAPVSTLRVNGIQAATSVVNQGTGNYGTYPLYIGARAGTANPFIGYLYSLIVRGAATNAGQIASTEQWVAGKTGITI